MIDICLNFLLRFFFFFFPFYVHNALRHLRAKMILYFRRFNGSSIKIFRLDNLLLWIFFLRGALRLLFCQDLFPCFSLLPRFSSFLPFLIVSGSMPTKYKFQFFNAFFVIFGGLEMFVDGDDILSSFLMYNCFMELNL